MKSLCLATLMTIAIAQQAMAALVSPPKVNQPQTEAAYFTTDTIILTAIMAVITITVSGGTVAGITISRGRRR